MSFNDRIRKLCRVCGDEGSMNIFGLLGQSLDLSDKINKLLPINVALNDRLSTMICNACVNQIITINYITRIGMRTNDLMIKLLEMNDNTFRERMLKLCRICGNPGLLDIYNQYIENPENLAHKINSFSTLQVSSEDQLSLKICQSCNNQIEYVYPIFLFCRNTTKLMSIITGNISLDTLKIEAASFDINKTFKDIAFDIDEILIHENKENEFDNYIEEEHNTDQNIIHMTQETFGNTNQTQCLRCTETFINGTDLRRHILLNHNLKELDCHHCFRRCSSVLEFENHVKLHFPSECIFYPCDLCSTHYISMENLVRHIKTHDVPRTKEWALTYNLSDSSTSFCCKYCDKTFLLEASRRIHERIHLTCFICETCGKQLPNKSQLSVHQRQHTGERPYQCTNCGSSFKCLSTLRQHEVVHTEKRYRCEVCMRKFSRPEKVRIHMRVHTGEKPYNCLKCLKKYQQKNDLNRHIKKKHNEDEDNNHIEQQYKIR